MLKVLIAPQEFKGTLTAAEAAQAMATGLLHGREGAQVKVLPIADGGGGTVEALLYARDGEERFTEVTGPLGAPVRARWGVIDGGETAVLEMAAASGLTLLSNTERDPLRAHTFGTGELIRAALDAGCKRVLLGAGGSATCDGGTGALTALGARFLDDKGSVLPLGPAPLSRLAKIELSGLEPRLQQIELQVLTDVRNPLLGEDGSARVFAPQKGADADQVEQLEGLMQRYAQRVRETVQSSLDAEPGAGAAGGLGFGLRALANGRLERGFDVVSEALDVFGHLADADWVLTGEGRLDVQTAFFKGTYGLGRLAKMQKKRVVLFAGSVLGAASTMREAFDDVVPVGSGRVPSKEEAAELLQSAVMRWALRQSK